VESVTVVVEPSALERNGSGNILGPIRLHSDAPANKVKDFPEHGWTDFVVVILAWWLEELRKLRQGEAKVFCRFMDGPLGFRVTCENSGTYRIDCVEERLSGETAHASWTTSKGGFESALVAAGSEVLLECGRRNWESRDIDTLRNAVRAVRLQVAV
jgi:hypothetical protein